VLGAGHDQDGRYLGGSIAERVLRDAPCPTFVVPASPVSETPLGENILCAVDFSPASDAAVEEAVRLSTEGDGRTTLFHVVDKPGADQYLQYPRLAMHEYHRGLAAVALDNLKNRIPPASGRGVVMARVAVGKPVTQILRAARAMDARLLVIGARSRNRIGRTLFGKTSRLLRDVTCPVLAVPAVTGTQARTDDLRVAV
jgi:nucleotide-binding universal stress UspA family protein